MDDVRWTQGGRGGRGPTAKTTHRTNRLSALPCYRGPDPLAWWKLLVLTGKKLAFKFSMYIFEYRAPPPLRPPRPLAWWMLPGLPRFSPVFRSRVLLWTQTEGKNGGGLENKVSLMTSWEGGGIWQLKAGFRSFCTHQQGFFGCSWHWPYMEVLT